jgi:ABC-2 type transport system permease protein
MGYFGVECGNTLGICGALLAGIVGITALSKEERDGTAEILLTMPVSRKQIVSEKLLFCAFHITVVNLAIALVSLLTTAAIGVEANYGKLLLILLAYYLMQLEIMAISFGISAFLKNGGLGIGIGIAFGLYFLNIIANLAEALDFVKYITPFGFADSAHIVSEGALEPISLIIGTVLSALGVALAYFKYTKKDIA